MMRTVPDRSQPVPLIHAMGSSELDGPNGPLHRIPLVQITADDENDLRLEEMGAAEWLSEAFIREVYGVAPSQLKSFRVPGNAMSGVIEPGERVRGILWQGESLRDGAVYFLQAPTGIIVRRLHLSPEAIQLTAENTSVSPQEVSQRAWRDNYRPLARVVEVLRAL